MKDLKKTKNVKKTKDGKDQVLKSADREEVRQEKFVASISKPLKDLTKNAINEKAIGGTVKRVKANVRDKRLNDPEVQKLLKPKLSDLRSRLETKAKNKKYEYKNVSDEFAEYLINDDSEEIEDLTPVDHKEIAVETNHIIRSTINEVFKPRNKVKSIDIAKSRSTKGTEEHFSIMENKEESIEVLKPKVSKKISTVREYSKEDSKALRDANMRRKAFKKQQKKERQAERKKGPLSAEAGEEEIKEDRYGNSGPRYYKVPEDQEELRYNRKLEDFALNFDKFKTKILETLMVTDLISDPVFDLDVLETSVHVLHSVVLLSKSRTFSEYHASLNYFFLSLYDKQNAVSPFITRYAIAHVTWKLFEKVSKSNTVLVAEADDSGKSTDHPLYKLGDLLEDGVDVGSLVFNGHAFTSFSKLLTTVAALHILPKELAFKVYSVFGDHSGGKSIIDLVQSLMKSLGQILKMSGRLLSGESISSILSGQDPYDYILEGVSRLNHYVNNTYTGNPIPGRIDEFEWHALYAEVYEEANRMKLKFNPLGNERRNLDNMLKNIQDYRDELATRGANLHRIAPLAFAITGRPGIGKSKLIDFTLSQHALAVGRKYSPNLVFHRNKSKHWSGYEPLSQPYIHFSEIGNEKPSLAAMTGNEAINEMLSVCDSLPYNPPMAAIRDKNRAWVKVEAVAIDGNFADLGIPALFRNPGAYFRRLISVEPVPKREFVKHDGQIDSTKCLDSESDYFDKWLFNVYVYSVTGNNRYEKVPVLENADCYAYARYIRDVTLKHVRNENRNVEIVNNADSYLGYTDEKHNPEHQRYCEEKEDLKAEAGNDRDSPQPGFLNGGALMVEIVRYLTFNLIDLAESFILSVLLAILLRYHQVLNKWGKGFIHLFTLYVMICWFGMGVFLSFLIQIAFYLFMGNSAEVFQKKALAVAYETHSNNVNIISDEIIRYIGVNTQIRVRKVKTAAEVKMMHMACTAISIASVAGVAWTVYKRLSKNDPEGEGCTDFVFPSEYNEHLNSVETAIGAGESYKRIPSKLVSNWENIRELEIDNTHTSGVESLSKMVQNNVREIIVRNGDISCWNVKGLGLKSNALLLNTHSLPRKEQFWIEVGNSSFTANHNSYTKTLVDSTNRVDMGNDVSIVWVTGMEFKDITKHILRSKSPEMASYKTIPALFNGVKVIAVKDTAKTATFRDTTFSVEDTIRYEYPAHAPGMCGIPLLGQVRHVSFILGVHFAGYKNSPECFSTVLDYASIMDVLSKKKQLFGIFSELSVTKSVISQIDQGSLGAEAGLDDPSEKSPTRFLKLDHMKYYGKIPGEVNIANRSNLVKNVFVSASVSIEEQFFQVYGHIQKTVFEKPVMKPGNIGGKWICPFNIFLEKASQEKTSLNKTILRKCIDVYKAHILSHLTNVEKLSPLNFKTAINGAAEDCFIRKIDMKKAAGFGFSGKKSSHVELTEDEKFEPGERLKKEAKRILNCYKDGKMAGFIYNAQLKDEPRDREKVKVGKTRVFFASSFGSLVVSRMFLAPFYSLMVEQSEAFCTAIGIDMHRESGKVLERMVHGNIMAGDYGSYDTTIPFDISWATATLIIEIMEELGYNDEALMYLSGILSDGLFPIVALNKDVFMMAGMQPSGKYATAEDNSLKGVMLLLYAWYSIDNLKKKNFFNFVNPVTYGDDVGVGVDDEVKNDFNDLIYAEFCMTHYNMKYTNSQKGDVDKAFTPLKDFTFLKRSFVWSTELNRYISPLDMDSIMKTFTWRMVSKNVTETDQVSSMCISMLHELWFHSNSQQYNNMKSWIVETLVDHYGNDVLPLCDKFPSYHALTESYNTMPQIMEVSGEDLPDCNDPLFKVRAEEFEQVASQSILKKLGFIREHHTVGMDKPQCDDLLSATKHDLIKFKFELQTRLDLLSENKELSPGEELEKNEIEVTITLLTRMLGTQGTLLAESGPEVEMKTGAIEAPVIETRETVVDAGGNVPPHKNSEYPPHTILVDAETDLQNFLKRPVQIFNQTIPLGTDFDRYIQVWNSFTNAQSVRAKLKNFAYIHANLHVRIAVSGTPFHYGKLQVAYIPFAVENKIVQTYGADPLLRYGFLQYSSQQKCVFTIDAKDNTPVDCMFPFISPAPMARLHNGAAVAVGSGTPFTGVNELGELHLHTLNQFQTVSSGVPTEVYVTIYAWMEDVKLGVPTATVLQLIAESGDEMFKGPFSNKLNMASRQMSQFSRVPMIGSHAIATADAFKAMGKVASMFGFSKPVAATEPSLMKNEPFRNGANTTGTETLKRITLDPLQQVSLNYSDGVSSDEMSFAFLCARESLYTTFVWSVNDTPTTGSLIAWGVNPTNTLTYYASIFRSYLQPSPLAMCAMPHQFWRGRIKYRFEIVVSAFHRGKLAVVYEPNVSQYTLVSTTLRLNKQHTCIIDIQETQDFEFCVDMAFPREWCRTLGLQEANVLNSKIATVSPEALNGFVRVHAFTALQSPDSSSVGVNVYVSGENMEFNRVSGINIPTRKLMAESGLEQDQITCVDLNQRVINDGESAARHFGERSVSFRSLLKRYATVITDNWTAFVGDYQVRERLRSFPPAQPTPLTGPSPCNSHWFHYVRQAYLGMRGGRKFRYFQFGMSGQDLAYAKITLDPNAISDPVFGRSNADDKSSSDGTVNFAFHTNYGVEYEIPFYENNLWLFANNKTQWPTNVYAIDRSGQRSHTVDLYFSTRTAEAVFPFAVDFAIGEDFNFLYFTGCPPYTADSVL